MHTPRLGRGRSPAGDVMLTKDLPVLLVDCSAATFELETLFELEPQYGRNEVTMVEVNNYFLIRHVATGRYLHALESRNADTDGEADKWAQALAMVASMTKHNEDGTLTMTRTVAVCTRS